MMKNILLYAALFLPLALHAADNPTSYSHVQEAITTCITEQRKLLYNAQTGVSKKDSKKIRKRLRYLQRKDEKLRRAQGRVMSARRGNYKMHDNNFNDIIRVYHRIFNQDTEES